MNVHVFPKKGVLVVKYVRLKDIAERAGVSINTVSRALKEKDDISAETTKKIREIADELGYVPHAAAASLRSKATKTIGVIVTYLDNPFYARILKGVNAALAEYGYTAMTWENGEDIAKERHILTLLAANRVAGVLIVPASNLENDFNYDRLKTQHLTIVRKGTLNTQSYFILNSFKSGQLVGDHFLQAGRKNAAFLGVDLPISCNERRLAGYTERLEDAGLPIPSQNIRSIRPSSQDAYQSIQTWMKEKPDIDALFVYNDQLAFGVLRALHDLGIKVPDDIAVVSHDDVDSAQFFNPSLTTIRVPKYNLGFESAECLINMIQHTEKEVDNQRVYEPALIVRESSK
jgi:LacI family transcriptional regulator